MKLTKSNGTKSVVTVRPVLIGFVIIVCLAILMVVQHESYQSITSYLTFNEKEAQVWKSSQWTQCLQSATDNQLEGMIRSVCNNLYAFGGSETNKHKISPELQAAMNFAAGNFDQYHGVDENTILFYVGGNENAEVAQHMMNYYHFHKRYIFEPIPSFVRSLETVFANYGQKTPSIHSSRPPQVKILPYGIADVDATLVAQLASKSTQVLDSSVQEENCDNCENVSIRDAYRVITEIMQENPGHEFLFYSNCEGCEIPTLERILDTGLVHHFKYIHFATHFVTLPFYEARLCKIRERLGETHDQLYAVTYAQERYKRKDL